MTKEAALYRFFSSFGMDAYPSSVVPDAKKVIFPYITYDGTIGNVGDSVSITAQIWFRTESESQPNEKVAEISNRIGLGGVVVHHDDGAIWVRKGTPWCNSLVDDEDATLKRRILNLELEFL